MSKTDEIKQFLVAQGLSLKSQARLSNDLGDQLRFTGGEIVNVYDNGTVQAQGRDRDHVKALLAAWEAGAKQASASSATSTRNVFVVYGHDQPAKTQLEAMLRRWELEPLFLDQLPSRGGTIIDKLERYASADVCFAVVLATPDDIGYRAGDEAKPRYRARQNVILELGLLLAKLGRAKVAILLKDQEDMEKPSDIEGLIYFSFASNVEEVKTNLFKEMAVQGIGISPLRL